MDISWSGSSATNLIILKNLVKGMLGNFKIKYMLKIKFHLNNNNFLPQSRLIRFYGVKTIIDNLFI